MDGEKIKRIIKENGFSLVEIAAALGMSKQNFSMLLKGDNIKSGTMEDIARAMGKPVNFFYTGESSGTAVVNGGTVNGNVNGKVDEGNDAVSALVDQLAIKDRQIDRLLGLLEKSSRLRLATGPAGENMES